MPVLARPAESGPPALAQSGRRRTIVRTARVAVWVAATALAVTIIALLPRTTGTTWPEIGRLLSHVTLLDVVLLTALWALALLSYSGLVLTGALPGLKARRAITLNLTGSSVANVVPLGGAWGVGLNVLMLRRWGYAAKDIASFLMISNIWNVLAKLALSAAVVIVLAIGGLPVPISADGARAVTISAVVSVVILISGVVSARVAGWAGLAADAVAGWALRLMRMQRRTNLHRQLPAVRLVMLSVLRRRWFGMTAGMAVYLALQGALLWACLHILGNRFTVAAVLTAYAVDRLLTAVPLTPGGSGVVEAGTAGALIALGGAPTSVAAAVLLYRAFTFLAEIPIGGIWALGWFAVQRRRAGRGDGRGDGRGAGPAGPIPVGGAA